MMPKNAGVDKQLASGLARNTHVSHEHPSVTLLQDAANKNGCTFRETLLSLHVQQNHVKSYMKRDLFRQLSVNA